MKLSWRAFYAVATSAFAFGQQHRESPHITRNTKPRTASNNNKEGVDVGILSRPVRISKHIDAISEEKHPAGRALARYIGSDSCIGSHACSAAGLRGNFSIGNETCTWRHACQNAARELGASFVAGNKCCGGFASCYGAGQYGSFYAGDNVCNQVHSCGNAGFYGNFGADNGSCGDYYSCLYAGSSGTFAIGKESCQGESTCYKAAYEIGATFTARDGSCDGFQSCYKAAVNGSFAGGSYSCYGKRSCAHAGFKGNFTVGSGSCLGEYACYEAAFENASQVGNGSCIGERACTPQNTANASFTVGHGSCTCAGCCENMREGSIIGDCRCVTRDEGCFNATKPIYRPEPGVCPSGAPSTGPTISSRPSSPPSISVHPSFVPSSAPSAPVVLYQNLTFDSFTNLLGLTNSDVTISLNNLVNDNNYEPQDLVFNNDTDLLSLSNSTEIVDLSHLHDPPQHLKFNNETNRLGMTESENEVDLSLAPDLTLENNRVTLSSGGSRADLSSMRIVTLQASIEDIVGDDTSSQRRRYLGDASSGRTRKLGKKDDEPPQIGYGGKANMGWALISSGRLLGLSVTANCGLTEGTLEIGVVDCTNDPAQSLGSTFDVLTLGANQGRSNFTKFATPISVEAGIIVCLQAIRRECIDSDDNDNAASLVLMLEQW